MVSWSPFDGREAVCETRESEKDGAALLYGTGGTGARGTRNGARGRHTAVITVCSLSRLAETVERTGARRLVTLISAGTEVPRPATIPVEDHLFLAFNDITAPAEGLTPPGREHVAALVEFVETWDRQAPLVIHCFAGISRSTAAAFISACALAPQANEMSLARTLRTAAPSATPNARLVALADDLLDRKGRMVEAVRSIGRGEDAFEGLPFTLDVPGLAPRIVTPEG